MIYTIKFTEDSLANFDEAITKYEKISEQLADRFYNEFWKEIDVIKKTPLHYQCRYKTIRIEHLKVFPFGIHFIIDTNVIKVLKILHHKQYYK